VDNSDAIRLRAFAEKVKAMRDVQKRHFAGERGLVPEARRLEAEVDRSAEAILDRQDALFET
jgi:hypothetical protein